MAAAVVYLTSINLAAWGQWLLGALLIGIVVSFATLIFHFPISSLAISLFLGVVFVGLTFFDFWRVKAATRGQWCATSGGQPCVTKRELSSTSSSSF